MKTLKRISRCEIADALTAFRSHLFQHPLAKDAFRDLCTALGAVSSPQIIIFTGPTGVGKTTLSNAAHNRLMQHFKVQMEEDPNFVPVVTINAVPPNGSGFSWKDFHIRLLAGQNDPLINSKLFIPRQGWLFPGYSTDARAFEQSTADTLRRATEEYLRQRKTKFLLIDEAHHMLLVGGRQRLECQFECLKSLTIETGLTILLTGTYRLLDILEQSGQLTRRSQIVNFRRYDQRRTTDPSGFRQVLKHFEKLLSEYVSVDLDSDADYFYRKSAGCIGILKDWLCRCLEYALLEEREVINATLAERFAHKNRGLKTIIEEACIGETKLADIDDGQLDDLLQHGVLISDRDEGRRSKRRPGQRNPVRDPVGGAL